MAKRGSYVSTMRAIYRRQARMRNIAWSLSREEFAEIVLRDCHYCGAEPRPRFFSVWKHETKRSTRTESKERVNGIDRVDNALGYTAANSVACCGRCNAMKSDISLGDWVAHIARVLSRVRGAA